MALPLTNEMKILRPPPLLVPKEAVTDLANFKRLQPAL
jgi:hypothetical protein